MNAIETEHLGKRYGATWALCDVSVTVPAGRVCALVGANGAGKTTLLRMLAGMARPTSGAALVGGQPPADDVDFLRRIGYVAQDVPLYRRWTVADHLRMAADLNDGWDGDGAHDRLAALDIPLGRRVGELSGGMRAQVALALGLGKRPDVLLLDEPLAALDPLARRSFMATLVEAVAERPLTVILSSHLLPDLERICDHVVVLADGHVVLADTIEDVLATHRVLTSASRDTAALAHVHDIVAIRRTARQVTVLARLRGAPIEPGWDVDEPSLEEILLAYLGASREAVAASPAPALSLVEDGR